MTIRDAINNLKCLELIDRDDITEEVKLKENLQIAVNMAIAALEREEAQNKQKEEAKR